MCNNSFICFNPKNKELEVIVIITTTTSTITLLLSFRIAVSFWCALKQLRAKAIDSELMSHFCEAVILLCEYFACRFQHSRPLKPIHRNDMAVFFLFWLGVWAVRFTIFIVAIIACICVRMYFVYYLNSLRISIAF